MHTAASAEAAASTPPVTANVAGTEPGAERQMCHCATSLAEVESAWHLVYNRYTAMGLINENPFGIHVAPTGVGPHACVIWGPDGPEVGYTMTLFEDNPAGLALDSVYPSELAALRQQGRRLLEVGLLADRRHNESRGLTALLAMMRWAIHRALHTNSTDIIIGVHPRHAQFYMHLYAFEPFGEATVYPLVRNHAVIPLRLRLPEALARSKLPRGLRDARAHPIAASAFDPRFAFTPAQLQHSLIAGFMRDRYGVDVVHPAKPPRNVPRETSGDRAETALPPLLTHWRASPAPARA